MRKIRAAHEEHDIKARHHVPGRLQPAGAGDDRRYYPIYQTCIDLDIPIISNAGIAGPRFPSACQDVMHFDEVCYDFPELRIVMRHGAEPWEALAVKLMLKWPNLYYMTSAFAPKYYPKAIIDYANTRGAEKVMYAGYFPMGLSLERIFTEMPNVPFRDHVWPKFLRDNAMRVFKLDALTMSPMRRIDYAGSVHDEEEIEAVVEVLRGGRDRAAHRQERAGVRAGRRRAVRQAARGDVQLRIVGALPRGRAARPASPVTRSSRRRSRSRPTSRRWCAPGSCPRSSTSSPTPTTSTSTPSRR